MAATRPDESPNGIRHSAGAHAGDRPARARRTPARWAMWGLSALLVGLVVMFVVQAGIFDGERVTVAPDELPAEPRTLTAETSQFTGYDKNNQPYAVAAGRAVQDRDHPSRVYLTDIRAELKVRTSGDVLLVTALKGVLDTKSHTLDLEGDIRLISTDSYAARLQTARVHLKEKRLRSEDPVEVTFPDGMVAAKGMEMWDDGQRILFFNGSRANFAARGEKGDSSVQAN